MIVISSFETKTTITKEFLRLTMQQSRLEKFFSTKNSSSSSSSTTSTIDLTIPQQTNKRSTSTDELKNKKLKRTQSNLSTQEENSQSNDHFENTFSLSRFYLDKFLLILSSLLQYHRSLFNDHELKLFHDFQELSGRACPFSNLVNDCS